MSLAISIIDVLAACVFGIAVVIVLSLRTDETSLVNASTKSFLLAACLVYAVVTLSDVLDQYRIATPLEAVEDSIELLWAPFLLFALYSLYARLQLLDVRAAQDKATRADKFASDVISNSQSGVITIDSEGRVVFANDMARELLDLGDEEIPDPAVDRHVHSLDHGRPLDSAGFRCLLGSEELRDVPLVVEWQGKRRRLSAHAVPLHDASGKPTGALVTFVDQAPWLKLRA